MHEGGILPVVCWKAQGHDCATKEMWSAENVRRHHNYVPLVVDLFKVLAEKGKLQDMVAGAREKAAAAKAKAQDKAANAKLELGGIGGIWILVEF